MGGTLPWYVARSSGVIAWAVLAASVLWGLAITTRVMKGHPSPSWLLDLHRYLGGVATVFVGVHIVAILADTFVHFSLVTVLVPFAASWHPVGVAWGIAAFYLLVAVEVTSLLKAKVPRRVWRATHYASFPLFIVATAHGLSAGTDGRAWLFQTVAALTVAGVGALTFLRLSGERQRPARRVLTSPP